MTEAVLSRKTKISTPRVAEITACYRDVFGTDLRVIVYGGGL